MRLECDHHGHELARCGGNAGGRSASGLELICWCWRGMVKWWWPFGLCVGVVGSFHCCLYLVLVLVSGGVCVCLCSCVRVSATVCLSVCVVSIRVAAKLSSGLSWGALIFTMHRPPPTIHKSLHRQGTEGKSTLLLSRNSSQTPRGMPSPPPPSPNHPCLPSPCSPRWPGYVVAGPVNAAPRSPATGGER